MYSLLSFITISSVLLALAGIVSSATPSVRPSAAPSRSPTRFPSSPGQLPIELGTAAGYAALAGTTVTSTGVAGTALYGNVGVYPGTSVTGFPPAFLSGEINRGNGASGAAEGDLTAAYNTAAGKPASATLSNVDLGGMTLQPGVYKFDADGSMNGRLTLDALGNSDAVWTFQIGEALFIGGSSSVIFKDSIGNSENVYWQVGSSAVLNKNVAFIGTIMALQSISVKSGASVLGRLLARNGAVTLDYNTVTIPQLKPTAMPTTAPTPRPTTQNSPLLTFESNITIAAVTLPLISYNGFHAVTNATATCMGIDKSAVSYISQRIPATRRALMQAAQRKQGLLAAYTIISTTSTSLTLSSTDYDNTDDMYNGLTDKLSAAIADGSFTTLIRRNAVLFDAPELLGADGTGVVTGDPIIDKAPKSDDKLGGGAIAGIVIGVVVGVALIACLAFLLMTVFGGGFTTATAGGAGGASTAVATNEV